MTLTAWLSTTDRINQRLPPHDVWSNDKVGGRRQRRIMQQQQQQQGVSCPGWCQWPEWWAR